MRFTCLILCITGSAGVAMCGVPAPAEAQTPGSDWSQLRVIADVDGDGEDDLLSSGPMETFGMSGGAWDLYLSREGEPTLIGQIVAHPGALTLEPVLRRVDPARGAFVRIWVYLREGGGAGTLGYYEVSPEGLSPLEAVGIQAGDGGTDVGRALYEAVFSVSPIPYRLEGSTVDADGAVRWQPYRPE